MKQQSLKMLKMLVVIFSLSNVGCDNLKGLVITQLDTKNNIANPFKITKVDKKSCKLEVEDMPSHAVLGPELHGAFCLSADEFARYKAKLQAECKKTRLNKWLYS